MSPDGATVFVGSDDSKLYAVDFSSGNLKWSFTTGGDVYSDPTVSRDGATVFVGSFDSKLFAVDTVYTPEPITCVGRGRAACTPYPSTWCCNLAVYNCVCQLYATLDEIRNYCSGEKNGGINCEECKAAPQCRALAAGDDLNGK